MMKPGGFSEPLQAVGPRVPSPVLHSLWVLSTIRSPHGLTFAGEAVNEAQEP